MPDTIETLYRSTIHHGPHNDRLYLMKLHLDDIPQIVTDIHRIAYDNGYEKISVKIPLTVRPVFEKNGYLQEAVVPGLFAVNGDGAFMARYFSEKRQAEQHPHEIRRVFQILDNIEKEAIKFNEEELTVAEQCGPSDAEEMSLVYRTVFKTYPFPIYDPAYLIETMASHMAYYCVRSRGRIVALASGDMDEENRNVEMTDFAVLKQWRKQRLATLLLAKMEIEMARRGMRLAYTIARLLSPGINIMFKKMGYAYAGKLTNNTHIAGRIESMGVWFKPLEDYSHSKTGI